MFSKFFVTRCNARRSCAPGAVARFLLASALTAAAHVAGAQRIVVGAGATNTTIVAPGTVFSVPIVVDMTAAGGTNFASFSAGLSWGAGRITLDSIKAGSFGTLSSNFASGTASIASFNAVGTTSNVSIANLFFTSGAATGGTQLLVSPTAAGADRGAALLPELPPRVHKVCAAQTRPWGPP